MAERICKTAFGPVNAAALERLRESFETQRLLDAVDQMDHLSESLGDSTLRKALLRLHGMAHIIFNDAPKTVSSGKQKVWELAGSLALEVEEMMDGLGSTLELLNQLAELAPEFAQEDIEGKDP